MTETAPRARFMRILWKPFLGFWMVLAPCYLSAQVVFSASQLVFPDTIQGTTSPPQSFLVTNNGASPILLAGTSLSTGGFGVAQSDCPFQTPGGGVGTLGAGAVCTIQIQFTPYAIGPLNATFSVYVTDTNFNFVNQPSILLSGTGLKPPPSADLQALFASAGPSPVDEGGTVTLQVGMVNQGPDPATNAVISLAIPSGYTLVSCNNASTLLPCDNGGASPSITVASMPAFTGVGMNAVIKVPISVPTQTTATGDAGFTPMAYTVTATSATADPTPSNNTVSGAIPIIPPSGIGLSATSLDFGLQLERNSTPTKQITLTSVGPSPLSMNGISIQGVLFEFQESDNCPKFGAALAVGSSCTIAVYVNPKDEGLRSATLSIADSAPDSPQKVSLSATGHPLLVDPLSVSLPIQLVNTSGGGFVQLTNYGNRPVKFQAATITGDFSYTDGCAPDLGDIISPGESCALSVSFTPTTPGPHTGTLTIFDDDVTSPQVIQLSGAGTAAVVSTASLEYPIQTVGVTSSQTVTLTNAYTKPLAVHGISASGDYDQKNDCGRSLAPNSSCNITVTFSPTDLGPREGTLVLNENDPSSPQSVALSGFGVAPIKHVYVHYDYMVLPDQGTACTPRNEFPGDFFSSDCAQSQSCINNVCRGHSHAPDQRAIDAIVEAFRLHGSELHIDPHHTAIPEQATIEFGPRDGLVCPNAIDPVNFYDLRDQYYQPSHKFEHYAIFGHFAQDTEEFDCSSLTGVAELPPLLGIGQNFVVALGSLTDLTFVSDTVLRWQAGTFMHELGHNLGLNHGGGLFDQGDFTNYKPNFISVMNYYDQPGILQADAVGSEQMKTCSRDKDCGPAALCTQGNPHRFCTRYDYSDQLLPTGGPTPGVLDENGQLSEPAGLGSGRPDLFFYSDGNCLQRTGPSDGPVDWDGDGDTTGTGLAVDLLFLWWSNGGFFNVPTCPSGIYIPVVGHNDWADLVAIQEQAHTRDSWKSNPNPQRQHELTFEEAKARHILLPPRPVTVLAPSACSSSSTAVQPSSITLHLLGTDDLDVSQIDLSSLKLHGVAPATVSVADVNGDGRPDLVLTFPTTSLKLHPNAKRMTLTGFLKNSQSFWGHAATGCQ